MSKIAIIDYGAGNVQSIGNMLDTLGEDYEITDSAEKIKNASKIIFPGQGHFEQAMKNLESKGLIDVIKYSVACGVPFLGICLGLQVLFESSEEAEGVNGLGLIKGSVKKFTLGKIPQIGWNRIKTTQANTYLSEDFYYFVNSYYVIPEDASYVASTSNYHIDFCASVQKDNLTAVQFHPEKSASAGLEFFKRWCR